MTEATQAANLRDRGTGHGATVVVGAAQGIGSAIARRLSQNSDTRRMILADIRFEAVSELAHELASNPDRAVEAVAVDVGSPASIQELAAKAGDADRLAIVAGIFDAVPSLEASWEEFAHVLEVNLLGAFFVAQAFAARMIDNGGGSIVAVGSIAARMPRIRQAAYCASKAGMRQALRVLAMEIVPYGVRVNFVSPGPTNTPMMRDLSADHDVDDLAKGSLKAFRPRIPTGRVGQVDDIAEGVAFLLSDAASHIAMHDLYVDGGESLGL